MLIVFYFATNFEAEALCKIMLIFAHLVLRVNMVLFFAHLGQFFREWAKISTRENSNC